MEIDSLSVDTDLSRPSRDLAPSTWDSSAATPLASELPEFCLLTGHPARSEHRMVLATIPLPANPMDTNTGVARPGTVTRSNRML